MNATRAGAVRAAMPQTREAIEALKSNWLSDPGCYDIENTDGFEEHREELAAFRAAKEAEWEVQRKREHEAAIEKLLVPARDYIGSLTLAITVTMPRDELVMRTAAAMLLPVVQRLDRIVDDYESRLTAAQDKIHKLERDLANLHRDTIG